ncbi:hypothetical protein CAMGR0001_1243 [Campylobacter gracilis RM3268]|uniref:Uncharacterized protein n=1 Tax=Campylobacter gracilis RM3268 TaxID=553220 RepID=C8PJ45_9BACT|nr:hypothetical protein CAMGR0001_1243 [Campylobacter gracilis RM3268]
MKRNLKFCAALILVATIRSIRLEPAKFSQISRSAERKIFPREPINSIKFCENFTRFKGADHARSSFHIGARVHEKCFKGADYALSRT